MTKKKTTPKPKTKKTTKKPRVVNMADAPITTARESVREKKRGIIEARRAARTASVEREEKPGEKDGDA